MKLNNLLVLTLTALASQGIQAMNRTAIDTEAAAQRAQQFVQSMTTGERVAQAEPEVTWHGFENTEDSQQEVKRKRALNQQDFVKTVTLFNLLPEELQQQVYGWDKKFTCLNTLTGHDSWIRNLEVYKDNTVWKAVSGSPDGTVRVWNLATGQCLLALHPFHSDISAIRLYEDNGWKALVSSFLSSSLVLIDLTSGEYLKIIDCHATIIDINVYRDATGWKAALTSQGGYIRIVDLSSEQIVRAIDGRLLTTYQDGANFKIIFASGGLSYRLYVENLTTGQALHTLAGHTQNIDSITTYQDATGWKALSASYDHTLRIWDLATGNCLHILQGHDSPVNKVAIWQDATGWKAISGSWDNILRVWDLATGKQLYTLTGPQDRAYSHIKTYRDSTGWKAVCSFKNSIQIWDLATRECLQTLTDHTDSVYCLQTYVDDENLKIVSASSDKTLRIWGHTSACEAIRQEELTAYRDLCKANKIISMMSAKCGDGTSTALQRLIFDYAKPENT